MTLDSSSFKNSVEKAADALKERIPAWKTPSFYLHFGTRYAIQGLFDDAPETVPLAALSDCLPERANLDGDSVVLQYGFCNGVAVLAATGTRHVAEGDGLHAALFPTALASTLGIKNHIFLDTAVSLTTDIKTGKWGVLTDFVNGFAFSPLDGLQDFIADAFPNFFETFDQIQNSEVLNAMADFGDAPILCSYHGHPDFNLPTPGETDRIRNDGAKFLGHDLVLHLILSHAMGRRVSALVLAGAQALPGTAPRLNRNDMLETSEFCSTQMRQGLRKALREMENSANGYAENILPESDADELIRLSIQKCATRSSPLKTFLRRKTSDNSDETI